jgi:hypothetical protein
MLLHGLLSYVQRIGDFFVSPALRKILDDRLFAVRQVKLFLSLIGVQMLTSSQFFHGHDHAGVLDTAFIR